MRRRPSQTSGGQEGKRASIELCDHVLCKGCVGALHLFACLRTPLYLTTYTTPSSAHYSTHHFKPIISNPSIDSNMSVLTATTSRRRGDESRCISLDLNVSCMFKHPSLDIIAVSGKGFIVLLNLDGKQMGKIEKGVENVQSVTFDPTGRWVFASVSPERRDGKVESHIKKWELADILEGREREGDEMVEIARLLTNNAGTYLYDLADWPDLEIAHILPTFQSDIAKSLDAAILSRSLLLGHAQEGRVGSFGSQKFSKRRGLYHPLCFPE
jgi:hypothetical protein